MPFDVKDDRKFRLMVEYSNDILVFIDKEGYQMYISPSAERVTGFSPQELQKPFSELLHPDDVEATFEAFCKLVATPCGAVTVHYRHKHKNGDYLYFETTARNFLDDPEIQAIVSNVRDISERHRAQEAFLQSSKLSSIGLLAAGVIHELTNPLTLLVSQAESLKKYPYEEIYPIADKIEENIERCVHIVNSLSMYSKKKEEIKFVDIHKVIIDSLGIYTKLYFKNHIKIVMNLKAVKFFCMCNQLSIQQIIFNLFSNAIYAMKDSSLKEIRILTYNEDSCVVIKISDTGTGISEENKSKIFTPFFTTKSQKSGTGLGLYICREIVTRYQGHFYFESQEGHGTDFFICLPFQETSSVYA